MRIVGRWAAFYTRDLEPTVAAERRDELASDLWEQGAAADARGTSAATTGLSILVRAARGIPADLSWRRQEVRGAGYTGHGSHWTTSGSVVVAWAIALLTFGIGAIALLRVGVAVARGEFLPSSVTLTSLALGLVALLCGIALLRQRRQRWLAAFWLAASSLAVLHFGAICLITLSATAQTLTDPLNPTSFLGDPLLSIVGLSGLSLFYLAASLAWLPPRHDAKSNAEVHP